GAGHHGDPDPLGHHGDSATRARDSDRHRDTSWTAPNFQGRLHFMLLQTLGLIGLITTSLAAAERPNLVLVFADDQRFDAMSCAGHPFLKTPNMDRLAREGAYCKNAF